MLRFAFVSVLAFALVAFAQVPPEEAMAKLKAKQQARAQVVNITQGELDDLRAEINSLKSQLAAIKINPQQAGTNKIEPIRSIYVGATREQVQDFIRRHPNEYEIIANAVSTAQVLNKTTVSSIQRQGSNSINPNTGSNVGANQNEKVLSQEKTITEGNKNESITLLRKAYVPVVVGSHTENNGISDKRIEDTQKQWIGVEKMFVHMTNDQVSEIERAALTAPNQSIPRTRGGR